MEHWLLNERTRNHWTNGLYSLGFMFWYHYLNRHLGEMLFPHSGITTTTTLRPKQGPHDSQALPNRWRACHLCYQIYNINREVGKLLIIQTLNYNRLQVLAQGQSFTIYVNKHFGLKTLKSRAAKPKVIADCRRVLKTLKGQTLKLDTVISGH